MAPLLVISDFDGTLAGFNTNPMNVPVNSKSIAALEQLATQPNTRVVILSGRSLVDLQQLAPVTDAIELVGSHGAEGTKPAVLSLEQQRLLAEIEHDLRALITNHNGARLEVKPFHRVLHTRGMPGDGEELLQQAMALSRPGVHVTHGKCILEFSVLDTSKGGWIRAHRGDANVIFIGDDATDETGFAVLGPTDMGIKVGPGDTQALLRLASLHDVADFLSALAAQRS
ncbi:trehalose-phosphatase [Corynebacterium freiburgense]|uniref:trehalose-phosphatase n=1 Tax=Corynebacterium freiburgense TaxID=556548 RepID=UPI00040B33EC|nr:trehalose-phosphatase [Corynebacterium freiburgense]WJZ03643.1 Trehalose-6-phosphate phosphatase [Corynebacterium freiburgense]